MTMSEGKIVGSIVVIAVVAIVLILAVMPVYNVWSRELSGKAELKEAEWNRQIAIEEAQARLASAELDALSEVERAKGVAEANKIIGTSLKDNSEYLIWRWIEGLHDEHTDVIYIPTEANIPIIEIGRSIK